MKNARERDGSNAAARKVWSQIMSIYKRPEPSAAVIEASEEIGVHPGALKALFNLEQPQSMSSIAERMFCDASYVTSLADDLEKIGYIERMTSPSDRRVKLLFRTKKGTTAVAKAKERIVDPPEFLLNASQDKLEQLAQLLEEILEEPVTDST